MAKVSAAPCSEIVSNLFVLGWVMGFGQHQPFGAAFYWLKFAGV
jgi:hypothetical protein